MATNWPRIPAFDSDDEIDVRLPERWRVDQIENLYDQLPIGKRFDQKCSAQHGSVPVIDQSADGVIGWHDEQPGILASTDTPVVTFANHTCEMRLMRRPFSVIQNVFSLVGKKGTCDTRFLYYGTKGRVNFEEYKGHYPDFRRKWVLVPPLPEQGAIAHILGSLDDKIELNRRMNETLEAMARALFKSWFVDFNPVRSKAEGRDTGLPKSLADLFPASLVDSELGEIPEGWEVGTLANHFDAVKGVSYKGSGLADAGTPLHNLNSVYEGGGYKYEGIKHYTGEYAERHVVQPGDVIVTNTEQGHDRLLIGFAAMVPHVFGEQGIASHHIYRMRPKRTTMLTPAFLCHLLNSARMHEVVSGYANGTTVNMLPIDGVQKPEIVVPSSAIVEAFDELAMKVELRSEALVVESRTLAVLRDALLPKLISGALRVTDVDRILQGIVI